jgi:potassium/hydrogen antiporter
MDEIAEFGTAIVLVAAGLSLALAAFKITEWLPVPAPALFLFAAAIASDVFPSIEDHFDIDLVARIGVVALIIILLDGGMHVGRRRFRASAIPIAALGVVGTFATAAVVAGFVHYVFDVSWITSWLIGAAVAPTDPAVMFSVLGNREIGGRTGTILEGESGANDPVGIALMIGLLEYATADDGSVAAIGRVFALQMAVGLVVGVIGAQVLIWLMQNFSLPREGLYSIRVLAFGGVIYGTAAVFDGSGFLAVFVAGLLIGDIHAPYKREIEGFHTSLASLAEIAVFVALGMTIDLTELVRDGIWLDGIVLALFLALVARPFAVGLLLVPVRLHLGERLFVVWGGLKGAVPILLAAFALSAGVDDGAWIYTLVFIVVAFSVVVQGSSIPLAARRLAVPMRLVELGPSDYSVPLGKAPSEVRTFVVDEGSRAAGNRVGELPLGENAWISLVVHGGEARQPRGSYVLEAGDEVHVLTRDEDARVLERLFGHAADDAVP